MLSFTKKNSCCADQDIGLNYKTYRLTPEDRLRQGAIGAGLGALIAYTFYRSIPLFVILTAAGAVGYPLMKKEELKEKRLWQLTLEFKDAIWMVSGYLSAGLSVENAFAVTASELKKSVGEDAMITREFASIVRELHLNKPVERLLMDFADRSGLQDIRNFAEVFVIAKRSGGSMSEIIERTTGVIRDRVSVSEEIKNMTASQRYEQNIMSILPFLLIFYINLTSGGFLDVMYETAAGRLVMTFCLFLLAASGVLSRKILSIEI